MYSAKCLSNGSSPKSISSQRSLSALSDANLTSPAMKGPSASVMFAGEMLINLRFGLS